MWAKSIANWKPHLSTSSTWSKCTRLSPSLLVKLNNHARGRAWVWGYTHSALYVCSNYKEIFHNTRRHPYTTFMKSSIDYMNDDVLLDVSLYLFFHHYYSCLIYCHPYFFFSFLKLFLYLCSMLFTSSHAPHAQLVIEYKYVDRLSRTNTGTLNNLCQPQWVNWHSH